MQLVPWIAGLLATASLGAALDLRNPVQRAGGDVKFSFTGAEDKTPVLKLIQNAATLATIGSDIPLVRRADDDTVSEFALSAALASPGLYKLVVQDGKASKVFHAALTTSISIAHATVHGTKVEFGSSLPTVPTLKLRDTFSVEVGLQDASTLKPVVAHQAVLRFTSHASSVDATYLLESSTNGDTMHVVVTIDRNLESGVHDLQLIVGDVQFENAIVWDVGQVTVDIPPAPPAPLPPLYTTPLLHESDITLQALPEIVHVMRPPATRPSDAVSRVFTALVLLPLPIFIVWVLRTQSLPHLPSTFGGVVSSIGFLASVGAVLGLYGLYWVQLTMFSTLGYLAVLGPVVVGTGHFALQAVSTSRAATTAAASSNKPKAD